MPLLMLKEVPRYECLLQAAQQYPVLEASAFEAFLHLLQTADSVFGVESALLTQKGISQGRFTVLMLLSRLCDESSSPAALAEKANVTRATMTGLLNTLEKDGMIVRETSADDRRAVLVKLTEEGGSLLARILPSYCKTVSKIMEPLNDLERHTLVELLQKIHQPISPGMSPEAPAVSGTHA